MIQRAFNLWRTTTRAEIEAGRDPIGEHFDQMAQRVLLPAVLGMCAILAALLVWV